MLRCKICIAKGGSVAIKNKWQFQKHLMKVHKGDYWEIPSYIMNKEENELKYGKKIKEMTI